MTFYNNMKYLNSYKLYEGVLSKEEVEQIYTPIINWDLINDAKDMSLEYLDNGAQIVIGVIDVCLNTIYYEEFSHLLNNKLWYRTNDGMSHSQLTYKFMVFNRKENSNVIIWRDDCKELIDRLRRAYPKEKIKQNIVLK